MLEPICQLARDAGAAIMRVYEGHQPVEVTRKKDDSPVTAADLAAHRVIKEGLAAAFPDIPLLSEEDPLSGRNVGTGNAIGWSIRSTAPKSSSAATASLR